MIPTRSASTSASSRYCVVRKTVTPSSFGEAADLGPERVAALRVEAGRRLVEEEDARAVDEREREVEAALHPARVRAHLAVGGAASARRARAARRRVRARSSRGMPCSAVWRRRCSRPVSSGSSAASWSAAPIAARTCGPSLTTSKPATRRRAGGRRQERGQHVHGRRLAGAVRAEEAVDLAGRDGEVDPVDRAHVLELADEPLDLDPVVRLRCHVAMLVTLESDASGSLVRSCWSCSLAGCGGSKTRHRDDDGDGHADDHSADHGEDGAGLLPARRKGRAGRADAGTGHARDASRRSRRQGRRRRSGRSGSTRARRARSSPRPSTRSRSSTRRNPSSSTARATGARTSRT